MNIIKTFKHFLFHRAKLPLGRWNIHNHKETTIKIQYANEDNCGVCHSQNIIKTPNPIRFYQKETKHRNILKTKTKPANDAFDDNKYLFMMGFESVHT